MEEDEERRGGGGVFQNILDFKRGLGVFFSYLAKDTEDFETMGIFSSRLNKQFFVLTDLEPPTTSHPIL